jgi:aldose 1-epimerase
MTNGTIEKDKFGATVDGVTVDRYALRNARGLTVRLITYGATVTELWTPDRNGKLADIVLGFDRLAPYEGNHPYFGCIVGRVAFRIAQAEFTLDGKTYQLTRNDGPHHLHGGTRGFSRAVWRAEVLARSEAPAVRFTHRSSDGDQGYPGTLEVAVIYCLTDENELKIDYTATTDRPTPVNLTHHSYFNLAGAGHGDVLGHVLQLDADRWIPIEESGLPSGRVCSVKNTPFDFTRSQVIGPRIGGTGGTVRGYDVAYLCNHHDGAPIRVARLHEPGTGRVLEVLTSEPAMVLYTGNYLDGSLQGKGGVFYGKHAGTCLETGHPPDAVHHPQFPSIWLRPQQTYRHTCVYRFSIA